MSRESELDESIRKRHSPRAFSSEPISRRDLTALLEAARWAPSSFNEQPWRFIVASSPQAASHADIAACLTEHNRRWAADAPVLMLTFARTHFTRNNKRNPHARHDVGLAVAQLTLEAVSRDIFVHQMAGILEGEIQSQFDVPEAFEPVTGLAAGYPPDDDAQDEGPRRDRQRLPLSDIAFDGAWGTPWPDDAPE